VGIVSRYARYYGGVEYANRMLAAMLEEEEYPVRVISEELLGNGLLLKARKRLWGVNRLLAGHFARYHAADVGVAICNGEFGLGVHHPAAINVFHGCYSGYAEAMRPFISARGYRGLLRLAHQQKLSAEGKWVVAVSTTVAVILGQQGVRVDAVINNAVDLELFRPAPETARNDRYLFVGSSDYHGKGFDILEKLASFGIPIDCVTANRPSDERLGWLGNIPNEDLPEYYRRYRALLLPSRFEGSSLVVLEAMACGTPVVTTAVGSGPDIAREIPEFVVDGPWGGVPEAMAARLALIEGRHEELGRRAREYVMRHHSMAAWKQQWLDAVACVWRRSTQGAAAE